MPPASQHRQDHYYSARSTEHHPRATVTENPNLNSPPDCVLTPALGQPGQPLAGVIDEHWPGAASPHQNGHYAARRTVLAALPLSRSPGSAGPGTMPMSPGRISAGRACLPHRDEEGRIYLADDQQVGSNLKGMDVLDFEGWNSADWDGVFAQEHIDAMKTYVDSAGGTPPRIT